MRKTLLALSVCFLASSAFAGDTDEVAKLLHQKFPRLHFQKVEKSPVKGLYEIHAGTNIIYTDRNVDHLIFGEIYDVKGRDLTAEKRQLLFKQLVAKMSEDFPKNAIHIKGKKPSLFLIVDPDCPFSRQVLRYLLSKDADMHLIFFGFHKGSYPHALYILSSRDKKKALEEVINGRLDGDKNEKEILKKYAANRKKVDAELKGWREFVQKYGVRGVPFVLVPSKQLVVQGARMDLLGRIFPVDFSKIDLSKAPVVVGHGGKKVVVVTDPTCPFCRRMCNALRHYAKEGKVTFYVFFLPVHGQKSMDYIADILDAPKSKRPELLEKIFEGKFKTDHKPFSPQAQKEFREELEVVRQLGVSGTPTFIFPDGTKIVGARLKEVERKIEENGR
jgi:thiol:disulfide interchange protein DsbC